MVKLSYFLPQASDPVAMKKQLVECGVLDLTNELIYKMAPEAVDPAILSRGSLSIRQYTRSALKLLREDLLSNKRPFCMNDPKLKTIDIWKLSHSYKHQDSYSVGNDDRSISNYRSPSENQNRNGSFRQYPFHRSRSFNEGGRNFASSSHLMPKFMVRQQKQNTNDKEIYFGPKPESFEKKNEEIDRDKSKDKTELKELESEENNSNQAKSTDLSVEKSTEQQSERNSNNPFLYPQDGDDECSTDGKNLDLKNHSATISSISNNDVGVANPFLNRDDRRIGSGRISLGNEWEYFNKDIDKSTLRNNSQQFASEELQKSRQDRFHTNRNRRRYDSYSSKSNTSNDEPEWFSAGPTSRLDVIELHGFDDDCSSIASDSKAAAVPASASATADKTGVNNKKDDEVASVSTSQSSPPPARSTPTKYGHKRYENRTQNSNNPNQNDSNKTEFMFDTFFNPFANGSGDDKKTLRNESENSPRPSPWIGSNSGDINLQGNSNPQAPNRKSFYDNWANNSTNNLSGRNSAHQNDFFNNSNVKTQLPYRVSSVEELEAKMFHASKTNQENLLQMLANISSKQYQNQQYQEKEQFKYLINQMSSANIENKSVNFYQEQQKKQIYLLKHQQQQDILRVAEILQKFAGYSLTAVPINQMSRGEILNRPEAQAILQAIVRNEISINSLFQIINNTTVPYAPRNSIFEYNREIILTVLNFIQLQKQHQQQQQAAMQINSQLNLLNNFLPVSQSLPQRVPSARELQFHTQSIMKSALLRKKMEGQKNQASSVNETFGDFMLESSLSTSGNPSSSTNNNRFQKQNNLFTPTSVLKNINAAGNKSNTMWQKIQTPDNLISDNAEMQNKFDFDGHTKQLDNNLEQAQKHIQWSKPELHAPNNIKSIGRSILKKSTHKTTSNNEPIQNLQTENAGELQLGEQQQEPSITSYSNISPSKNQLAKWFTPELLAQASAGKLPSLNRSEVVFLEEFEKNAHQS